MVCTRPQRVDVSLARIAVHAATGLCALLLGILSPRQALICAGIGVALGWILFPATGVEAKLKRSQDGFLNGLKTYPLAVFLLVALLPASRAAAAWAILAFGDSAAAWVGSLVTSPRFFGHPKATWAGSTALFVIGALTAYGCSAFVAHTGSPPALSLPICALAACAAVVADLLPLPIDDNLPIAAAAGLVLGFV